MKEAKKKFTTKTRGEKGTGISCLPVLKLESFFPRALFCFLESKIVSEHFSRDGILL